MADFLAKIEEKEKARQDYEKAREEGKRASLLEQQRPNVFQMNVANIMPGDRVEVILKYTELLIPEKGVYGFIYPTVVGPRYSTERKTEENQNSFIGNSVDYIPNFLVGYQKVDELSNFKVINCYTGKLRRSDYKSNLFCLVGYF